MLEVFYRAYRDAVIQFELLSEAVLEALAADEIPSGDLLASEEQARANVLSARTVLLAEIERRENEARSEWPLEDLWVPEAASSRPPASDVPSASS